MRYRVYSEALKEKYGEKVYKLPVNLPVTCPNRDGLISTGGCVYCGEKGAGFESLGASFDVKGQLLSNMDYIGKKYHAGKFIAYFQNFSNTYLPPDLFGSALAQAALPNIVGADISTRPDCIAKEYLDILKRFSVSSGLDIGIELGLQTVNYHTLKKLNRGHTLAEFIDSIYQIHPYGFPVCAHLILDLPDDTPEDVIECAKILSALRVSSVKLHSLYIVKNTVCHEQYQSGSLRLLSPGEYADRCVLFLRHLSPEITVQRLIGRAPEEDTVIANYHMSWWRIKDMILEKMERLSAVQGDLCDYLGGKAVRHFI